MPLLFPVQLQRHRIVGAYELLDLKIRQLRYYLQRRICLERALVPDHSPCPSNLAPACSRWLGDSTSPYAFVAQH